MQSNGNLRASCETCGVEFWTWRTRPSKFCSRACLFAFQRRPERFWSHVDKNGPIVRPELGPCWIWTGGCTDKGYGKFRVEGRDSRAHRVSWEMHNGPIPEDHAVCHKCDNPPCVRPDHLEPGTHQDNMTDRNVKGRSARLRGSLAGTAKLTEAAVLDIRVRYKPGSRHVRGNAKELAAEHGVTKEQIYRIAKRSVWTHI